MNKERTQTPFTLELTQDGSPTLKMPNGGESMHHSGGAALETQYIYKTPIEWAFKHLGEVNVHVVGLGLGYIEISWAVEFLKTRKFKNCQSRLTSFEVELELVENFKSWFLQSTKTSETKLDIYNTICQHLDSEVPINDIKQILSKNYENSEILNDLFIDYKKSNKAHVICFDAFSSKTTQNLWSEDFLNKYINQCAEEDCIFTTYACTGVLKRALKNNGFVLNERLGFKGKRDSTFAVRGLFKGVATPYQIF